MTGRFLKAYLAHQSWSGDFHFLLLMVIILELIPMVCAYATCFLGNVNRKQMSHAFGSNSQMLIGGIGNYLHEIETLIVARLGGHRLAGVTFHTLKNFKKFHYVGAVDHNWSSHNFYESWFDFFLGTVPLYITSAILWLVQCFLGENHFHLTANTNTDFSNLWYLKTEFMHSLSSAFNAGGGIRDIFYFIVVVLIASTAYSITMDELNRMPNGAMIWLLLLVVGSFFIIAFEFVPILTPYLWDCANFSAFALGRIVAYLLVIIIISTFFTLINYGQDWYEKHFKKN